MLALLLAAITASPPPVFGSGIDKVYVDAFVTRGARAVPGLREQDFEVRDEGVPQKVELLSLEEAPVSVILALDMSGSVAGQMLTALRAAAHALVEGVPRWDHVGLLAFNNRLALRVPPSSGRAAVVGALDGLQASGGTALRDAIYAAIRISAPDERRVVVVFSDGADTRSWLSADAVREASRRTGAILYAVCRTPETEEADPPALAHEAPPPERESGSIRELRLLAESTGGLFLEGADPRTIHARFQRVIEDMSTRYVLAFVPTARREGAHRIEVKLRSGKGRVRYRPEYVVPPARPSAPAP